MAILMWLVVLGVTVLWQRRTEMRRTGE